MVGHAGNMYIPIEVPKKSNPNKVRTIDIPCTELKGIQRAILLKILEPYDAHRCAFAYVRGKSPIAAATRMKGRKYVLRVDVASFFPSISARRVFGLFRHLGFPDKVSYMLSRLVTHNGQLTQGAPTSPAVSNLICRKLDQQLERLASEWQIEYLRYSDDLFFFSNHPFNYNALYDKIGHILLQHGFSINGEKTRFFPASQPKILLGFLLDRGEIRLPRKTRRKYRAAFYRASQRVSFAQENLDRLRGMAEYYKIVYGKDRIYYDFLRIIHNAREVRHHLSYSV